MPDGFKLDSKVGSARDFSIGFITQEKNDL